jgi:enterobactin synthetase component D
MSDQYQNDVFNKELSSALYKLPKNIKWAATIFPQNHKEKLLSMNVELPLLSDMAVEKRKNEFYAGRWCATQAIYQTNHRYLTPKINADRSPLWPDGVVGSISHSNDKAISLVTSIDQCVGVGVDLQYAIPPEEQLKILDLVLSTSEALLFRKISPNRAFDVFFSAKESLYKALYPSCLDIFEHKDVEIVKVNEYDFTLEIHLLRDLKAHWFKGQVFTVHYHVAQTYALTWICLDPFYIRD